MLVYRYTTRVDFTPDPAGGGRVDYDEVCATKPLDKASPQLFLSAVNGTPHPTATLEVLAADGVTVSTVYDLTNVIVSSVQYGAPTDCQLPIPLETACLALGGFVVRAGP
jgi:type VI protein secretion system component Hcp